jgi:hypothetical protein
MLKDLISKVKTNDGQPAQAGQPNPPGQAPNSQPADPNAKPADGQSQPADPNAKPADGQSQPADPNAKPADGQSQPADPNAKPADGQSQPADPNAKPADGQSQPADPNAKPADGQSQPADPNAKPADGQSQPADPNAKPADGQSQPAQPGAEGAAPANQEGLAESTGTVSDSGTMKTISRESASMLNLLMEQIKALVEIGNNLNERTKESEKRINEITVENEKYKDELKQFSEKMEIMEKNMEKFIGLYEVVTNQYNPFLEASGRENGNEEAPAEAPKQEAPQDGGQASQPAQEGGADTQFVVEEKISGQVTEAKPEGADNAQPAATGNEAPHEKPTTQPLSLSNGKSASTLQDLFEELVYMDDNTFRNHVSDTKHDIADWVGKAMGDQNLATTLKALKTRSGLIKGISDFIHSQPPEGPTSTDFVLPSGRNVNDLEGLLDELIYLDDTQFGQLVTADKNPIADWVVNRLKNDKLGASLKPLKTKSDVVKAIIQELHSQNK